MRGVAAVTDGPDGSLDLALLGHRLREERQRRRLSLADLEKRSGVSSSMISAVERGTKAGTILILDRIATALGTTLARFLAAEQQQRVIVLRSDEQPVARDASGWERRILSPVLPGIEFEFMRTTIEGGVDAGVFEPHARGSREYVAIEKGTLSLTIDGQPYTLNTGDSIYYDGDCAHGFANSSRRECVYYLAMDVSGTRRGGAHHHAPRVRARAGRSHK